MHRATLTIAAAALFVVAAGACGSDDSGTPYSTTRDGRTPHTRPPRDSRPDPTTPGSIVLPTFPSTSSTDAPPSSLPQAGDITVQETWFADDGYGGFNWGLTYESTATVGYEYVPVQVRFLDSAGDEIGVSETEIYFVAPGKGASADYAYDLEGTPESIEVTIGDGEESDFQPTDQLTAGALVLDEASGAANGQITSTSATGTDELDVIGVWRDATTGKVTGFASQFVRHAQANGVTLFKLTVPDGSAGVPSEVFVTQRPPYYEPEPVDPAITITGSWFLPDGSGGYNWGVLATNGGTTTWSGTLALGLFYDANGSLVASDDVYFGTMRPGANAAVSYVWDQAAEPTRVEVVFVDGGYDYEVDEGALTISDIALTSDSATSATVTATVTSSFEEDTSYAEIVFVWRDAANAIVYAGSTYAEEITAGGTATVELSLSGDNLPTAAPTESYWID